MKLNWITKHNQENCNEYCNYVFTGKYLAVFKPSHHKARADGYVYIHQLQAEKKLNRPLKLGECVHHIDENKYNNNLDNLMIFKTIADHTAYHGGSKIYLDGDVWVANKGESNICPICGINQKDHSASMCMDCYRKNIDLKSKCPSKDILSELIVTNSIVSIGNIYGVSDNAVRKWCKKYNLPYKKNEIDQLKLDNFKNNLH